MLLAALAVAGVTIAACSSDDGPGGGDTPLLQALSRVAVPDAVNFIEFGDLNRIDEASGGTFQGIWGNLDGMGTSSVFNYRTQLPDVLGVDVTAADTSIVVGLPPTAITLVQGGQDEDVIVSTSTGSGWSGDDILATEASPAEPISLAAPQVRPLGSDVTFGGPGADLMMVDPDDAETLDADPLVGSLASCVGDVIAATFVVDDPQPVVVGVRPDTDDADVPVSIVCAAADDADSAEQLAQRMIDDINDGVSLSQGNRPFADLFSVVGHDVIDGDVPTAQVELRHTDDAFAISAMRLIATRDLPGLHGGELDSDSD